MHDPQIFNTIQPENAYKIYISEYEGTPAGSSSLNQASIAEMEKEAAMNAVNRKLQKLHAERRTFHDFKLRTINKSA